MRTNHNCILNLLVLLSGCTTPVYAQLFEVPGYITPEAIAGVVDMTYLKVTDSNGAALSEAVIAANVRSAVRLAHDSSAYSVCVRPNMIPVAKAVIEELKSPLKVATVIDFPLGLQETEFKVFELLDAKEAGADEYDVVADFTALRAGAHQKFYEDILEASRAAEEQTLKVIFENYELKTERLKRLAYVLARDAFIESGFTENRMFKTSTGFAEAYDNRSTGATLEDLTLMAEVSAGKIGVKASGGVSDFASAAQALIAIQKGFKNAGAGACSTALKLKGGHPIQPELFRIGTSSSSVFTPGKASTPGY
ncbi:MAG: deoxyribose-phosphate aldolase [Bdellovibrionales bacterium]|nr:deoxyribose-phosphate aldolase [Bdellovibrionales bacterium]